MKRETREWLRRLRAEDMDKTDHPAKDALDSEKRLKAENKRMRRALKAAVVDFARRGESPWDAHNACWDAIKRTRTHR